MMQNRKELAEAGKRKLEEFRKAKALGKGTGSSASSKNAEGASSDVACLVLANGNGHANVAEGSGPPAASRPVADLPNAESRSPQSNGAAPPARLQNTHPPLAKYPSAFLDSGGQALPPSVPAAPLSRALATGAAPRAAPATTFVVLQDAPIPFGDPPAAPPAVPRVSSNGFIASSLTRVGSNNLPFPSNATAPGSWAPGAGSSSCIPAGGLSAPLPAAAKGTDGEGTSGHTASRDHTAGESAGLRFSTASEPAVSAPLADRAAVASSSATARDSTGLSGPLAASAASTHGYGAVVGGFGPGHQHEPLSSYDHNGPASASSAPLPPHPDELPGAGAHPFRGQPTAAAKFPWDLDPSSTSTYGPKGSGNNPDAAQAPFSSAPAAAWDWRTAGQASSLAPAMDPPASVADRALSSALAAAGAQSGVATNGYQTDGYYRDAPPPWWPHSAANATQQPPARQPLSEVLPVEPGGPSALGPHASSLAGPGLMPVLGAYSTKATVEPPAQSHPPSILNRQPAAAVDALAAATESATAAPHPDVLLPTYDRLHDSYLGSSMASAAAAPTAASGATMEALQDAPSAAPSRAVAEPRTDALVRLEGTERGGGCAAAESEVFPGGGGGAAGTGAPAAAAAAAAATEAAENTLHVASPPLPLSFGAASPARASGATAPISQANEAAAAASSSGTGSAGHSEPQQPAASALPAAAPRPALGTSRFAWLFGSPPPYKPPERTAPASQQPEAATSAAANSQSPLRSAEAPPSQQQQPADASFGIQPQSQLHAHSRTQHQQRPTSPVTPTTAQQSASVLPGIAASEGAAHEPRQDQNQGEMHQLDPLPQEPPAAAGGGASYPPLASDSAFGVVPPSLLRANTGGSEGQLTAGLSLGAWAEGGLAQPPTVVSVGGGGGVARGQGLSFPAGSFTTGSSQENLWSRPTDTGAATGTVPSDTLGQPAGVAGPGSSVADSVGNAAAGSRFGASACGSLGPVSTAAPRFSTGLGLATANRGLPSFLRGTVHPGAGPRTGSPSIEAATFSALDSSLAPGLQTGGLADGGSILGLSSHLGHAPIFGLQIPSFGYHAAVQPYAATTAAAGTQLLPPPPRPPVPTSSSTSNFAATASYLSAYASTSSTSIPSATTSATGLVPASTTAAAPPLPPPAAPVPSSSSSSAAVTTAAAAAPYGMAHPPAATAAAPTPTTTSTSTASYLESYLDNLLSTMSAAKKEKDAGAVAEDTRVLGHHPANGAGSGSNSGPHHVLAESGMATPRISHPGEAVPALGNGLAGTVEAPGHGHSLGVGLLASGASVFGDGVPVAGDPSAPGGQAARSGGGPLVGEGGGPHLRGQHSRRPSADSSGMLSGFSHGMGPPASSTNRVQFAALQQHIDELTEEKLSLSRGLQQQVRINEQLAEENEELTRQYNARRAAMEELERKIKRYEQELEAQALSLEGFSEERQAARTSYAEASSRAQALAAEVVGLEAQVLQLKSAVLKAERAAEEAQQRARKLEKQVESLTKEAHSRSEELQQVQLKGRNLVLKLKQTETRLQAAEEKLAAHGTATLLANGHAATAAALAPPSTPPKPETVEQEVQCDLAVEMAAPAPSGEGVASTAGAHDGGALTVASSQQQLLEGQEMGGGSSRSPAATVDGADSPTHLRPPLALQPSSSLPQQPVDWEAARLQRDAPSAVVADRALSSLDTSALMRSAAWPGGGLPEGLDRVALQLARWLPAGPISGGDPVAVMVEEELRLMQSIHELLGNFEAAQEATEGRIADLQDRIMSLTAENEDLCQKLERQTQRLELHMQAGMQAGAPVSLHQTPVGVVVQADAAGGVATVTPSSVASPLPPQPFAADMEPQATPTRSIRMASASPLEPPSAVTTPAGRHSWMGYLFRSRQKKRVRNAIL